MQKNSFIFILTFSLAINAFCWLIPKPFFVEYGPELQVETQKVKINAEDTPATKLALEFLALPNAENDIAFEINLRINKKLNYDYEIKYAADKKSINVEGSNAREMFNATMILLQLLERKDNLLKIQLANVQDKTLWEKRFMGNYSPFSEANLQFAAKYQFSGLAYQHRDEWHKINQERFHKAFARQKKYADAGVLDFMLVYHIYAVWGERQRGLFNIASEENLQELAQYCKFAQENGFSSIMICADDWTPLINGKYSLINQEEKEKFNDSAGLGHAYLMTYLQQALPEVEWFFCPPVYSLAHCKDLPQMQLYLQELAENLPSNVSIVWTGPKVISQEIILADEKIFSNFANGHNTFIWDNSECVPVPVHRWESNIAQELAEKGIFVNAKAFDGDHWKTWFVCSANEYLRNPNNYSKDEVYARILQNFRPDLEHKEVRLMQGLYDKLNSKKPDEDPQKELKKLKEIEKDWQDRKLMSRWMKNYLNALYAKVEAVRPQMEVMLSAKVPEIDGKLDDECWKNIPAQEYRTRAGENVKAGRKTYVKALFNREAIYFAFTVETDTDLPDTNYSNPINDFFKSSDLIELFIKPGDKYMQLAMDHRGYKFDTYYGVKRGEKPKTAWEGALQKNKKGWTLEIKVPFALLYELGASPPSDSVKWQANFCREYNAGNELQCWSPTHANSFLNPQMFGTIIFKE